MASVCSSISVSMVDFKKKSKNDHEQLLKMQCKSSLTARMEALYNSMNDTMRDLSRSDKEATKKICPLQEKKS